MQTCTEMASFTPGKYPRTAVVYGGASMGEQIRALKKGVEIVSLGEGKMLSAGASEGFVIQYVNDTPVSTPQEVVEAARKSKRSVFIEGVTSYGKTGVFGFGKDE